MQNNKLIKIFLIGAVTVFSGNALADVIVDDMATVDMISGDESANSVANYDATGSVFQQITDLEQDKMLMKLEKERAELDLDLDRLAAEKVKLRMELDELSNRGNAETVEKQKIAVAEKEEKAAEEKKKSETVAAEKAEVAAAKVSFAEKYKLLDIIGAGSQLQSTIQDLNTGQRKKISVGKMLDDYSVMSISLYDGVIFKKGDQIETLHIGTSKE